MVWEPTWYNKLKRYSGDRFGRPAIVGSRKINASIRAYKRRNPPSLWKTMFGFGGGPTGRLRTRLGKRRAGTAIRRNGGKRRRLTRMRKGKHLVYRSALKNVLCQPSVEKESFAFNMNRLGNSVTFYKVWYSLNMGLQPSDCDRMLSGMTNLAANTVVSSTELYFDGLSTQLTFRNNGNMDCIVSIYKCNLRKDFPLSVGAITGAYPAVLTTGFNDMVQESKSTSLPTFTLATSTPYGSPAWCSLFKCRKIYSKELKPGNQDSKRYVVKRGKIIKKASYGLATADTFAGKYAGFRGQCFYLIGVHGGISHDESKVVTPLNNTDLHPTYSGFNLDCIVDRRITYRTQLITTTRTAGQYGYPAPTTTLANQDMWQENAPAEAVGDA